MDITCASVEKKINELTDKMIEDIKKRTAGYSHCFSHSRGNYSEPDVSL